MTYLVPVAPPVPVPSTEPAPAILAVAEALQPDLAQGFQIEALRLRVEMERAFGGSDADGAWDWKLAYEAGEVALVLFLRKFGRALLARGVTQVAFKPDWTKHAKAAPFKRNDAMLDALPVGVLVFPGNGIQENLADKAKKLGIPVMKFEKGA